jgi:RHS repeat-associated protein
VITDYQGNIYKEIYLSAYGEEWVNRGDTLRKITAEFTGKPYDSETGFHYFGARYYDSKTSRWISADPILNSYLPSGDKEKDKNLPGMGGVFNPVNIQLYHYAGNNPIRYYDPTGNETDEKGKITFDTFVQVLDKDNFKVDNFGKKILLHWLYGNGEEMRINNDPEITNQIKNDPYMREAVYSHILDKIKTMGNSKELDFISFIHVNVQDGEGILGINYLHGSNENVGDVRILGKITTNKDGSYQANLTITWNDIIDPKLSESTDKLKSMIANIIANPADYILRITFPDQSVINNNGNSSGWLGNLHDALKGD